MAAFSVRAPRAWAGLAAAALATAVLGLGLPHHATAQTSTGDCDIPAPYSDNYRCRDLGPVPGLPTRFGGVTISRDDPDVLLIGGKANEPDGALYSVRLRRNADGEIIGYDGQARRIADAAYNDGGIVYGPGGVLFLARWPANELGQTKPGSSRTDKIIDLNPLGVEPSVAGIGFVPDGYRGAGRLKLNTWGGGRWYDTSVTADGSGTYNITHPAEVPGSTLPGGPEGFTYVPKASFAFPDEHILVAEYSAGNIATYRTGPNGDPLVNTRRVFVSGLDGAEGAHIDLRSGDLLFSTFGSNDRVVSVTGFATPTRLVAAPVLARVGTEPATGLPYLRATLTRALTGTPIAGKNVTFRIRGSDVCSATTDARGVATCENLSVTVQALQAGCYHAAFAGSGNRQASATTAGILEAGDVRIPANCP